MRRLLKDPPKGVEFEAIGNLVRVTISPTNEWLPLDVTPYIPYFCPVCGMDAGLSSDRMATILTLEFEAEAIHDFPVWSHRKCFDACPEIVEA